MASAESEGKMRDLGFAFNDKDFSDRFLHLEMVGDYSDSEGSDTEPIIERLKRKKKKQKTGVSEEKGDVTYRCHSKRSTEVEVKTLHVCSAILAASSPFFYKLFKNGMRESQQKDVTLRINVSEEAALMDLLNYMYSSTLSATSVPQFIDVIIIADKFEVSSCMAYCCARLKDMPMTLESALSYVEISSSVSIGEVFQSLIEAAKEYLIARYYHVSDFVVEEEAMSFPLSAIEFLLGALNVDSEEDIYEFILKWGRVRYPEQKERQEILTKLVGRVLEFSCLHLSTLREIQDSPDFDSKEVSKLILESLYLNAKYPYGIIGRHHLNRDYTELLIKVMESESSPHLVVYLNLTKQECGNLNMNGEKPSQTFSLGGQSFFLCVEATTHAAGDKAYIDLFITREGWRKGSCVFDYEFAVLKNENSVEYKGFHKACDCELSDIGQRSGVEKLFGIPWEEMGEEYFVKDVMHLRVQFTIKSNTQSQP